MTNSTQARRERIKIIRDSFYSLMWTTHRQISQRLQPYGLTRPQFLTLTMLVAHGRSCTMGDLREVTFQDGPTMTGIVNRLIKMGYVERTRSEIDRRVVLVQATPTSIDLVNRIEEDALKDDLCGYAALTDDDLVALEQLLTYILRMYMRRYTDAQNTDFEEALKKLKLFKNDPICYAKNSLREVL